MPAVVMMSPVPIVGAVDPPTTTGADPYTTGGGATTTPTPSPSTTSEGSPVVAFSTGSVTGASSVLATEASATVTVTIGSARPDHVLLSANPPRITTGTATTLLAQVFDADGNPVANVPVVFQITASTVQGRLDSGGQVVFTDTDGRATDLLRTNSIVAGTITVTATTANNKTASVTVTVFIP